MNITAKNLTKDTDQTVEAIFAQWRDLSRQLMGFGVSDTEPQWHFEDAIRNALLQKPLDIPESADAWELYSEQVGVGAAARRLTGFTKKVVRTIQSAQKSTDLVPHFAKHLWRVDL